VTLGLNGTQATGTADAAGRWTATLPPMAAGGRYTLDARASSGTTQSATDILVGDVWLCSGQSNMEFGVAQSRGGALAAARAQNDRLRMLTVPRTAVPEPAERFEPIPAWQIATPQTVRTFSAACYYYALELQQTVPVPMGLVNASWGASL
jgi:sialate O-acetylesterase